MPQYTTERYRPPLRLTERALLLGAQPFDGPLRTQVLHIRLELDLVAALKVEGGASSRYFAPVFTRLLPYRG